MDGTVYMTERGAMDLDLIGSRIYMRPEGYLEGLVLEKSEEEIRLIRRDVTKQSKSRNIALLFAVGGIIGSLYSICADVANSSDVVNGVNISLLPFGAALLTYLGGAVTAFSKHQKKVNLEKELKK